MTDRSWSKRFHVQVVVPSPVGCSSFGAPSPDFEEKHATSFSHYVFFETAKRSVLSSPFRLEFLEIFLLSGFEKYVFKTNYKVSSCQGKKGHCTHGDGGLMGGMVSSEMSGEIARMVVSTVFGNCENLHHSLGEILLMVQKSQGQPPFGCV